MYVKLKFSKRLIFKNGLAQEICEVHMLRGPHEPLVNWSFGNADLAWSPFSKVDFYEKLGFIQLFPSASFEGEN